MGGVPPSAARDVEQVPSLFASEAIVGQRRTEHFQVSWKVRTCGENHRSTSCDALARNLHVFGLALVVGFSSYF